MNLSGCASKLSSKGRWLTSAIFAVPAGEDLFRREASQFAVMVLQVVSVDLGAVPLLSMGNALETPG